MDIDKQETYSSFFILVHKIKDLIILLPLIKYEQTSSLKKWLCIVQYRYNGNNNDENCKSLSPFEGLGFAIHINIIKYNEHAT